MNDIKVLEEKLLRSNVLFSVPLNVFIDLVRHFNMFFPVSKEITRLNFLLKIALTSIGKEASEFNILNDLKLSTAFNESPFHPHNSRVYLLYSFLILSIKFSVESSTHSLELVRETTNLLSEILRILTNKLIAGNIYSSISSYLLFTLFGACATALKSLVIRNNNEELQYAFTGVLTAVLNTSQEVLANQYIISQWKVC